MNKEQKKQIVEEFVEIFSESGFYLMDFKGFNVVEMTELRNMLREANVSMRVVKNTLAKRALKKAGGDDSVRESLNSFFKGPTGVVWSKVDSITPVRVLVRFLKKYDRGYIKAGLLDGALVKDTEIEKISKLPDKQELYAQVASSLNAPIIQLARVLNSIPQKFVLVIDAVREKKAGDAV